MSRKIWHAIVAAEGSVDVNWESAYQEGYKITSESASETRRHSSGKARLTKASLIEFLKVAGFKGDDALIRASVAADLFSPRNIQLSLAIQKQERMSP